MVWAALFQEALRADADRALSGWFAARGRRDGLWLIAAIDGELGRIARRGSEPMLHAILYQFWRDALIDDSGGGHPLVQRARRLMGASRDLKGGLVALVDAHEAGSQASPAAEGAIRAEARRQAILFELADVWLAGGLADPDCTLCEDCGEIWGSIRWLTRQAGQGAIPPRQAQELAASAARGYARLSPRLAAISPARRPAFLPLALASSYLHILTKPGRAIAEPLAPHPLLRLVRLWRAARRGF